MSEIFFREMHIPESDYNLGISDCSHGAMTGRMLEEIEKIMLKKHPQVVLVYGDTNSTLAGALAAAKLQLPVAHVEAGLRSFNRRMPEEINRVLTDHLADVHFCPCDTAVENLKREGICDHVYQFGDVMHDVLLWQLARLGSPEAVLAKFGVIAGAYALATVHRAENTDDPSRLAGIFTALDQIAAEGLPVLIPLHP